MSFATTNELKINVQDNIIMVLNKRYNNTTRTLNLDTFYRDTDLTEFCVLSQPKIMYFVLHLAKSLQPNTIKLSNNEIQIMNPLHAVWGAHITCIDLRNNLVSKL